MLAALTVIFYMATTSEVDIIASNPIKDGLSAFRRVFESTLGRYDSVQVVFSTAAVAGIVRPLLSAFPFNIHSYQNLVLDLILALQNQPAARVLPSRTGDRTVAGDLGILYGGVDSNQLDIALAIPLVEHIVPILSTLRSILQQSAGAAAAP
jgi:hypothetical protein